MILTIATEGTPTRPATDLGWLLHKHPDRVRTVPMAGGMVHVVWPEASADAATVAMLVELDPVGLVRGTGGRGKRTSRGEGLLDHYVNDRPYALSSFASVAIGRVFGSAMNGSCPDRPELVERTWKVELRLTAIPVRGGADVLHRLFEPLGYEVQGDGIPLDESLPSWGESRYFDVRLRGEQRVSDVLAHLYVLLPVLDDDKHYWVGDDEVDKLLRRGGDWLADHPERDLVARRYLRHSRALTDEAVRRLDEDSTRDPDADAVEHDREEEAAEDRLSLNQLRINAVIDAVEASGARRVVDLGCGDGKLVSALLRRPGLDRIVGVDVSHRALRVAARRLHLDRMPERQRHRIDLWQGALTYRDKRLSGFDAATVVEVIEHLDPPRLTAFESVVFHHSVPRAVIVTTPNIEYNIRWPTLPAGQLRHRDHRFEWTRSEFTAWATRVADRSGYSVRFQPIGPDDPEVGPPTQMAVFTR